MSPWLPELIKKFTDHGHTVGLTSNGVRTQRYYEELAPMLRYICLSWHPNPEDPDFLVKAHATNQHCFTKINLMMPADQWGRALARAEELKASDLIWEPVRVTQWHDQPRGIASRSYTPEQLKWFDDNRGRTATWEYVRQYTQQTSTPTPLLSTLYALDGTSTRLEPTMLINRDQNKFKGWSCHQGSESLFLQYTGEIGMSNCSQNRDLGWIQDLDSIVWPREPQVCQLERCACSTDIYISKTS